MADHAPRPCCHPGCGRLVGTGSYCAQHQVLADQRRAEQLKTANKRYNRKRADSDRFYDTAAWRNFRKYYVTVHPLCEPCEARGEYVPVAVVDHIKPFKEFPELALDEDNVRSLCRTCDNQLRRDQTGRR